MSEFGVDVTHKYKLDVSDIVDMVQKMADGIEILEEENASLKNEIEEANDAYEELEEENERLEDELESLQMSLEDKEG